MANDESAFREVEQELAADRQMEFFRKRGPLLIGGAVAIVLGVAGFQVWKAQETARAEAAASAYHEALEALADNPAGAREQLAALAADAPAGYAVLADLRRAGLLAAEGNREEALKAYRAVYSNSGAATHLRDIARIKAAYLSLPDGREAVHADLGGLIDSESVFGAYAREISAVAALDAGDYESAETMFKRAAESADTPAQVRARAEELAALAAAGKAGVNIKGEARVEDLMRALDAVSPAETADEVPPEAEESPPGAAPPADPASPPTDRSEPDEEE